ncbi:hypothetical protein [Enterobacter ludwigii]|uniref:hypothetical protein n=1 Tax=Enterobacter ludwigii TaxID=299767 RepID=UPI003F71497D
MTDKTSRKKTKNTVKLPKPAMVQIDSAPPGQDVPQADDLKLRFRAGSIPLQTDFADLIDLANIGRQAVGGDKGQAGPGNGLRLSDKGLLELNPKNNGGISVDEGGVGLIDNYVIKNGSSTIKNGSLSFGSDDQGIYFFGGSHIVKKSGGNIFWYTPQNNALPQICNADGSNASNISTENYVNNYVSSVLPKGIITMFSGTKNDIPKGWALCDGNNGTPDLRDRFIVMAGPKYNGPGGGSMKTEDATVTGTVKIDDTKLDISQIPAHKHGYTYFGYATRNYNGNSWSSDYVSGTISDYTESAGGGKGHSHPATLTTNSHTHTINTVPPYYALIFIMKL